jgi:hypothetical protein
MNAQQIETAVSEFIASAGVSYSVQLVGATKRDDWECDEWRVTLKSARADYTFPFYTGTGHRKAGQPKAPHAASVLHSVVLDGGAIDLSFVDWCDEYGYDTDSRKALATYDECCESGRKLRKLFAAELREQLTQLLQDY